MVRSVIIRQVFVLLDVALALCVIGTLGYVLVRLFDPPVSLAVDFGGEDISSTQTASAISTLRPRTDYDFILTSGIFGDAGRYDRKAPPPPVEAAAPQDTPPPPTELNLRLVGTSFTNPEDPLASAIIEDGASKTVLAYAKGDAVMEKVTLRAVRQREVVLWNENKTPAAEEVLSMDNGEPLVPVATPAANTNNDSRTERITLGRDDIVQEIYASYTDLITKVKPEMYRDASGKVIGVTADNIGQVPLAQKLGLSDGDVLQTVNNEQIDSEQKIMEMVQKYRNAGSFRIGILRDGKPKVITYRLE
jgi:type II secretory pathway component PulC